MMATEGRPLEPPACERTSPSDGWAGDAASAVRFAESPDPARLAAVRKAVAFRFWPTAAQRAADVALATVREAG